MQSTMTASAPLQIQSVVDQVYDAVRARILSGDLPRGSRLRQAALADELGVSRTPLREALRRLATEGLVEFEANRGAKDRTLAVLSRLLPESTSNVRPFRPIA